MRLWAWVLIFALTSSEAHATGDPRFGLALGGDFNYSMPTVAPGGHGPYTLNWCSQGNPLCVNDTTRVITGDVWTSIHNHPGQQWTVLNEPELQPDKISAAQYAILWREFSHLALLADPTAQLFFPGMATNSDAYKTFLPAVLLTDNDILPSFFTFHAYPGQDGGTCEDPAVYAAGLSASKTHVTEFLALTSAYGRSSWLTEWGWIRNAPMSSGQFTAAEVNTPCVARYITDFVAFLKTTPGVTRSLYFPNGLSVSAQPWCDHNYATPFSAEWPCWSGGLTDTAGNQNANGVAWLSAITDQLVCTPRPRPTIAVTVASPGLVVSISDPAGIQRIQVGTPINGVAKNIGTTGFTVTRTGPGFVTIPFTIIDGCGLWPTFVGGGPETF